MIAISLSFNISFIHKSLNYAFCHFHYSYSGMKCDAVVMYCCDVMCSNVMFIREMQFFIFIVSAAAASAPHFTRSTPCDKLLSLRFISFFGFSHFHFNYMLVITYGRRSQGKEYQQHQFINLMY